MPLATSCSHRTAIDTSHPSQPAGSSPTLFCPVTASTPSLLPLFTNVHPSVPASLLSASFFQLPATSSGHQQLISVKLGQIERVASLAM